MQKAFRVPFFDLYYLFLIYIKEAKKKKKIPKYKINNLQLKSEK